MQQPPSLLPPQVFNNCRAYNQPGDAVWQMGLAVEAGFYRHWGAAGLGRAQ